MFFIALIVTIFISLFVYLFFINKLSMSLIFFITLTFVAVIYVFKYRDINDLAWYVINGETYRHKIIENFKFHTNNLIEIELNRNITYKLEFEFIPYQQSESDVKKFETMLKDMENLKVHISKEKNNMQTYESFNLYQNIESSWSAGTIIYQDNSQEPFVTGFSSGNFSAPFSLGTQKIYLKFGIDSKKLLNYLDDYQINLFITQKSF